MCSHFLYPFITKPSRPTFNTASLIDNIFTNNLTCLTNNGLTVNDLSDHLPIFSLRFSNVFKTPIKRECIVVRDFLGVLVDQHLSWKSHVSYAAKKISKTIGIMSKSRFYLSRKSLLSLYYTLVYPYLNYCNIIWSSNYPSNLNKLLLLQKRIVRIICGAEYLAQIYITIIIIITP